MFRFLKTGAYIALLLCQPWRHCLAYTDSGLFSAGPWGCWSLAIATMRGRVGHIRKIEKIGPWEISG